MAVTNVSYEPDSMELSCSIIIIIKNENFTVCLNSDLPPVVLK